MEFLASSKSVEALCKTTIHVSIHLAGAIASPHFETVKAYKPLKWLRQTPSAGHPAVKAEPGTVLGH